MIIVDYCVLYICRWYYDFCFVYDGLFAHLPDPSVYVFWHLEELICQFTPFELDLQCISVGIVSFKFMCALPNQPNKNPGCSSRLLDAVRFYFDLQPIVRVENTMFSLTIRAVVTWCRLERDKLAYVWSEERVLAQADKQSSLFSTAKWFQNKPLPIYLCLLSQF